MRSVNVDRDSRPSQQPGKPTMSDLVSKSSGNFGRQSPLQNSLSSNSPSLSPGLPLHQPPGIPGPVASQFGGYPVFETHSSTSAHSPGYFQSPPGYFQSPPPTPLYQSEYGQGHFGGCGGLGGELNGVYSYVNMGMTPQGLDGRFYPFVGRQNSMEEAVSVSLNDSKRPKICEPTIESIVSSLGSSNTSGTYTHFGPANPLTTGFGVGVGGSSQINEVEQYQQENQIEFQMQQQWTKQFDFNQDKEDLPGHIIGQADVITMKNWSPGLGRKFANGGTGTVDTFATTMQGGGSNVIGSGKLSPVSLDDLPRTTPMHRSNTPNGLTSYSACLKEPGSNTITGEADGGASKFSTSVKPSYLEILTKNNLTNGTTTFRRTSSPSSSEQNHSVNSVGDSDIIIPKRDSPTLTVNSNGHHIQPLLQLHIQGTGMAHRKSSDACAVVTNSSPGTSNSSTASSSPITKPKIQQSGKENNLSGFIKTPSKLPSLAVNITPVRSVTEKKGPSNGNAKKATGKQSKSHKFDFEIDDPDDDFFEGATSLDPEADEKSFKKKGKERKTIVSATNGNASLNGRNGVEKFNSSLGVGVQFGKKAGRERTEKLRSRKEERNCLVRRFRVTSKMWLGHLISALTWLWSLVLNVATLSAAVGYGLSEDMYVWWTVRALPWLQLNQHIMKSHLTALWQRFKWKEWMHFKRKEPQRKTEEIEDLSDLLAMLGPEKNILLPATGDEALRRLQSVKGQDPYSILGVRSNSPDETIRRYYKKQAVLVHPDKNLVPGAEEAFKILARAFELVGDPVRRMEYHKQLLEAHAKERFMGEFGSLFEQLRKKLESACTTIRCTKCNARHKKNKTNRPLFAARYCSQCRIHHGAREGELWAEKGGMFGFWTYYACMANQVWEINEWGKCQSESLKHLSPNSHNVLYRLVSGGQSQRHSRQSSQSSSSSPTGEAPEDLLDPELDDWDNLINNLCRGATNGSNSSSSAQSHKGSTSSAANAHGNAATSNAQTGSTTSVAGKKRKGKRK